MKMRENDLIDKIGRLLGRQPYAPRDLRLGMGDDAALFQPRRGHELVLTCDWFLEGTHFLRDKHPADSVGWKCLARAVSDIAAMGGVPRCFLLSLALPGSHTGRWLDEFLGGLLRASRKFQCVLAGGDTTSRKEILIQVTVVGEVRSGRAVLRSGARPNDILYVSGRLGEADSGLRLLRRSQAKVALQNPLVRKHLYPEPRVALGEWLARKRLATAMLDISDGLSSDLLRLCAASQVGARVGLAGFPLPPVPNATRSRSLQAALHGGDDYELLFTVPLHKFKFLPASFQGVPLTEIGRMTAERDVFLVEPNGRRIPLLPGGWDPFQEG